MRSAENSSLSSPELNLSFDLSTSPFYVKDNQNYLLYQTSKQLPVMKGLSLVDLFISRGHGIEPHWHPNANELLYVVQGEVIESIFNPLTLQLLTYRAGPQISVYIPMGWWHWTIALTDHARVIVSFDNNEFESVYGSDIMRHTPPEVLQFMYGINAAQWTETIKPIGDQTVIITPPDASDIQWRIGSNHHPR